MRRAVGSTNSQCFFCTLRSESQWLLKPTFLQSRYGNSNSSSTPYIQRRQATHAVSPVRLTNKLPRGTNGTNAKRSGPVHIRSPRAQQRLRERLQSLGRANKTTDDLVGVVLATLREIAALHSSEEFLQNSGLARKTAKADIQDFIKGIEKQVEQWKETKDSNDLPRAWHSFRESWVMNGQSGLLSQLKFALQGYIANRSFSQGDLLNQARLADMRYPYEWYPATRAMQRDIHLHIGPTNSGKTYHALKRLEQAKTGVYGGPLRLLAHEVYSRLNAAGLPCHLVTGDERILAPGDDHVRLSSCTVEMLPLSMTFDVAVVDEIQMIGSTDRGWAWTQAVLGLKAKELHLCGEARSAPLIKELAIAMGDKLHIHHYKRLSPLRTMHSSLNGKLTELRKGDCVVVFSRAGIHDLKQRIEKVSGKRVAVIYGTLPPEIRAQQAKLFNDPDNDYDYLVASDAIGMGLNLSIKRIIFESVTRFNGRDFKTLAVSEIKQIAGRAGRYRPASAAVTQTGNSKISPKSDVNLGLVTTLEDIDLAVVQKAMAAEPRPIESAVIAPPDSLILRFSSYFPPQTPLSYILTRLHEISMVNSRFHLRDLRDIIAIADILQAVPDLTVEDRLTICAAPVAVKDPHGPEIALAYAKCITTQFGGGLLEIKELKLELLDEPDDRVAGKLLQFESLNRALILYLWLSYRFAGIFVSQALAFHTKKLVEEKIDYALKSIAQNEQKRASLKKAREKAILRELKEESEKQSFTSRENQGHQALNKEVKDDQQGEHTNLDDDIVAETTEHDEASTRELDILPPDTVEVEQVNEVDNNPIEEHVERTDNVHDSAHELDLKT